MDLGVPRVDGGTEIGRGGFGVVYRAWQPDHHRTVAVKVLHEAVCDVELRARFLRERAASGMLSSHPHVVDVYDSGLSSAQRPYLVMEYMSGGSLGDRVAQGGPLPWAEVARFAVELAGALETAHRAGVLHRDIKPENLFVSAFGHAQLGDFGVARLQGVEEAVHERRVAGTLLHAAPELLDGGAATVAADLYALGSTVFALLAGRSAFFRDADRTMEPLVQRLRRDPVPDLRREGVPDGVCLVVERLMAKAPPERFPTAQDAGLRLQQVLGEHDAAVPLMALPVDPSSAEGGEPA